MKFIPRAAVEATFVSPSRRQHIITEQMRTAQREGTAKPAAKPAAQNVVNGKREVSKTSAPLSKRRRTKQPPPPSKLVNGKRLLFSLRDDDDLLEAILVSRSSKRNKSPYVGDIELVGADTNNQHQPLVHLPLFGMSGKCRSGARILVKPIRDDKGVQVSATARGGEYDTPKCQFVCQLLHVDESSDGRIKVDVPVPAEPVASPSDVPVDVTMATVDSNSETTATVSTTRTLYPPVWVGAHNQLGERIAKVWLRESLIEGMPPTSSLKYQVMNPGGADMRADFVVHHTDGSRRIIKVKTVYDTDYTASLLAPEAVTCAYMSDKSPYQRTAIFPSSGTIAKSRGGPGEKIISRTSTKQLAELILLANGSLRAEGSAGWDGTYQATLLLVVVRGDAMALRLNDKASPSFVEHLKEAHDNGVQILAKRVTWGTTKEEWGQCFDDVELPIEWD